MDAFIPIAFGGILIVGGLLFRWFASRRSPKTSSGAGVAGKK